MLFIFSTAVALLFNWTYFGGWNLAADDVGMTSRWRENKALGETSPMLSARLQKVSTSPARDNSAYKTYRLDCQKVVLYNIDVTAMCSVAKCKQSCLIDHLLHS